MKILQIAPYFLPYTGGQESYIYNLSKYLVQYGHEVQVLTSNYPTSSRTESILGIYVRRVNCVARPLRNPITPGMIFINDIVKGCDIIHVHNEHSFSAMMAVHYHKKYGKPLILTCHGQLQFGNLHSDQFEKLYSRTIGRTLLQAADRIITLSKSDKDYISSFGVSSDKITILPNAIDIPVLDRIVSRFKPDDIDQIRIKYDINDKKVILFTGSIIPRKGIEYFLRAVPQVLKEHDNVIFILTGNGNYLDTAKMLVDSLDISEHVKFLGNILEADLLVLYSLSDIFVLPSLSEGMSTSILEAMYFGLPVISTDIPGTRDNFAGVSLLVPPRDETELSNAIIKLLDDPSLSKRLSDNGIALVRSTYTWDKVTKQYEEIFNNLIINNH